MWSLSYTYMQKFDSVFPLIMFIGYMYFGSLILSSLGLLAEERQSFISMSALISMGKV